MCVLFISLACSLLCAQDSGYSRYIFGYGGGEFDSSSVLFAPGYGRAFDIKQEGDFIFGGGVGICSDLLGGMRFEIEGFHSSSEFSYAGGGPVRPPTPTPSPPPPTPPPTPPPSTALTVVGDIGISALMFNGIKVIRLCDIILYAGGGIGLAHIEIEKIGTMTTGAVQTVSTATDSDNVFAYQFIVGGEIPLTGNVSAFTQYKFLDVLDAGFTGIELSDLCVHSVQGGLRISF